MHPSSITGAAMKSEAERANTNAVIQTGLICAALEGLALVTLRSFTGGYVEAAVVSALWLGPLSLWLGPVLYRHLARANA